MSKFYTAEICLNGHTISNYKTKGLAYCEKCGAKVITECDKCSAPIHGSMDHGNFIGYFIRPDFCHHCGSPHPWTNLALETARCIIQEDDEMSYDERDMLSKTLDDILAETPKTQLAVVRFKKYISAAGKFTVDALRQFIIDFACQMAKDQLGIK